MDTSPEEQIKILIMINDAQREKINTLLKIIDDMKKKQDELLARVNIPEMQRSEVSTKEVWAWIMRKG